MLHQSLRQQSHMGAAVAAAEVENSMAMLGLHHQLLCEHLLLAFVPDAKPVLCVKHPTETDTWL